VAAHDTIVAQKKSNIVLSFIGHLVNFVEFGRAFEKPVKETDAFPPVAYPELSGNLADARHNEKSLWTPLESKPTDRQTWGVAPVTEPSHMGEDGQVQRSSLAV
jgi:hypothetical protein